MRACVMHQKVHYSVPVPYEKNSGEIFWREAERQTYRRNAYDFFPPVIGVVGIFAGCPHRL